MLETHLNRLNHYTARLDVLLSLKQTKTIKREVTICKREITYNKNRLGTIMRALDAAGVSVKCANNARKTGARL
jgi:hypothetical protein